MFGTIICSVNLTENSEELVRYTKELAQASKAKILVAHALPSTSNLRSYVSSHTMVEELLENAHKRTEEYVNDFIKTHFAGLDAEPVILTGNPARELLNLVDERCADLIVMGSMSSKSMFSFMFANYFETVIEKSRVPVIVVPTDLNLECVPPEGF